MSEVTIIPTEQLSVEVKIEQALVKENITDKIIAGLKENYLPLTINGQDDKEGYKKVVEARKDCKGWRIKASKVCKEGREEAKLIQTAWIAKEKEVVGKIEAIESHLEAMENEFEAERDRLKAEADAARELVAANRYGELMKLGAVNNGTSYVLGDVSYEVLVIKGADNDIYNNTILPKYKEVYDRIEAEKAELARIEAEQKAKLEAEKAELERQQSEFKAQQEAFAKQQEEAARLERERLAREQAEKEKAEAEAKRIEQERIDGIFKDRLSKLVGWAYNGFTVSNHIVEIFGSKEELVIYPAAEFDLLVANSIKYKEQQEREVEEKKQAEIKAAEERAAQAERDRIAAEQQAAEEKKQRDAELEAARIAQAKDKELWAEIIKHLDNTPKFDFRSSQYRTKYKLFRDFLTDLKEK